jgi:hypothetical protein
VIARHVQFPCGRLGLEWEQKHYGGSEITPSYGYYYNGQSYATVAINENVKLKRDYYGRIEGLKILEDNIDIGTLLESASSEWA